MVAPKILSDPTLKDAFYKQPTFWQTFTAELKGEKPQGNGILRALDILNKYDLRGFQNELSRKLTDNGKITIKFIDPITIENKDGKKVSFGRGEKAVMYAKTKNENKDIVLKGNKNGIDFSILFNVNYSDENNIYKTKIGDTEYDFQIIQQESPGFNPDEQD